MRKTVLLCAVFLLVSIGVADARDYYVSLNGDDTWSGELAEPNGGKTDGPFKTIEKARDTIRALKSSSGLPKGGVTVSIRSGIYSRSSTLMLGASDSGAEDAPVVWQAYPGEQVTFLGGKMVNDFEAVTDTTVLNRFYEAARDHILKTDLAAQGIKNYGAISQASGSTIDLYFQSNPMTLARFPNDDFLTVLSVPKNCENPYVGDPRTTRPDGTSDGMHCGKFQYTNPLAQPSTQIKQPNYWATADDIWMFGYWYWDWSSMYQKVESIDTSGKWIYLSPPFHFYGYRAGQRYYFLNVLEELDSPGEFYIDRTNGILYFWPPSSIGQDEAFLSTLSQIMVNLNGASYITFQGILFEGARAKVFMVRDCTNCIIDKCVIRNMGCEHPVEFTGGTSNGITGCELYNLAGGGVILGGGDRKTITPAGNYAINNHIHDYGLVYKTYHAAIHLNGVGNIVAHNLIHDAPHQAIALSGNEHIIEYNDFHDVIKETNDAGIIYGAADWTMRGTVIRYNFFHDCMGIGDLAMGVYFDPPYSGNTVYGNVFHKIVRAILNNSGRDNIFENNIFYDNTYSIHINNYVDPKLYEEGGDWGIYENLIAMNYSQPPYSERYPSLLTILDDDVRSMPRNNVIRRNIHYRGEWLTTWSIPDGVLTVENNLVSEDPHFVDAANDNFQLKDDSPAYSKIGFERIPFEEIGLLKDTTPVKVNEETREAFRLDQNSPNPFNPSTAISFSIPHSAQVKLIVYNMLGQEVAKLADGRFTAGTHRVVFDGVHLASGVYVYRFESGNVVKTKKMLMVK